MASLNRYFEFYNTERTYQSFGDRTPDWVYYAAVERIAAQMNWKGLIALSKFWDPLLSLLEYTIRYSCLDYTFNEVYPSFL